MLSGSRCVECSDHARGNAVKQQEEKVWQVAGAFNAAAHGSVRYGAVRITSKSGLTVGRRLWARCSFHPDLQCRSRLTRWISAVR